MYEIFLGCTWSTLLTQPFAANHSDPMPERSHQWALYHACADGEPLEVVRGLWERNVKAGHGLPHAMYKFEISPPWDENESPEHTVQYSRSVLHAACEDGHVDVVKFLRNEKHMHPAEPGSFGRSPLKIACEGKNMPN